MTEFNNILFLLVFFAGCALKIYAYPVNGTFTELDINKQMNSETKSNPKFMNDKLETIAIEDTSIRKVDHNRDVIEENKLVPFNEPIDRDMDTITTDNSQDIMWPKGTELTNVETNDIGAQVHDLHETVITDHGQLSDNTQKLFEDSGYGVILRIEHVESDRYDNKTGQTLNLQNIDNTTLPPLICWKMTCPDCSTHEPKFRCFARGIFTVAIRSAIFGVVILLLLACVILVNHKNKGNNSVKLCEKYENKNKGNDAERRCEKYEVVCENEKAALIDST